MFPLTKMAAFCQDKPSFGVRTATMNAVDVSKGVKDTFKTSSRFGRFVCPPSAFIRMGRGSALVEQLLRRGRSWLTSSFRTQKAACLGGMAAFRFLPLGSRLPSR